MKKQIVFYVMLLQFIFFYAQEELVKTDITLKKDNYFMVKEVFPIVNKSTKDIALLMRDNRFIYAYVMDENFKMIDSLKSDKKSRKFKEIIGNSISENNDYRIYLTDKKRRKFATINFSFEQKISTLLEMDLELKKESFVQTVNKDNKFYLLTITKRTSLLHIYKFNNDATYTKHTIDLSDYRYSKDKYKPTLYDMFVEYNDGLNLININKIETNTPNSVEITSDRVKLYQRANKLVFTFDYDKNSTQLLTIDPDDFTHTYELYEKPFLSEDDIIVKKTNSYLLDDKIYQIAATQKELRFLVKELNSKKVLKEYRLNEKDSITFKNSPIIQEGGAYKGYREMEKTKKFLRKVASSNAGIVVYEIGDKMKITMGGSKRIYSGGGGMMMPMGGFGGVPIASFGAVSMTFNPTYFAYSSYLRTKSTYIDCLFDKNYDHVKGEIDDNVFDMINAFSNRNDVPIQGETIFKYKDFYILGHYFEGDDFYRLRKFTDQ